MMMLESSSLTELGSALLLLLNHLFSVCETRYKIPSSVDIPLRFNVKFLESEFEQGILSSKVPPTLRATVSTST